MGDRVTPRRVRTAALALVVLLVAPTVVAGVTYDDPLADAPTANATGTAAANATAANATTNATVRRPQNVTFVSAQGASGTVRKARVVAIRTGTKALLWKHDAFDRYFDVDPVGYSRVLFVGHPKGSDEYRAVFMNWRTGEVLERFPVSTETHDVEYLGDRTFVVADGNHVVFVYDARRGERTWSYDFRAHYPPPNGTASPDSYEYTHLNDVDVVHNGSAFLLSPRNFDRVILVNRSTKETVWTLGAENDFETLFEQHSPSLIETSPPTVLVADSENHRVIEYVRENGTWTASWVYEQGLDWPRDADRLPNGHTLITDTYHQRVIEVDENGTVVWEFEFTTFPYDAERAEYGNEPAGPTMRQIRGDASATGTNDTASAASDNATDAGRSDGGRGAAENDVGEGSTTPYGGPVDAFDYAYTMALWVLPIWVGKLEFATLVGAALVAVAWSGVECYWVVAY